ncbi:MAG: DUF1778 domain-containing protein [Armatimonadetes bacterium]|nr:DUF1778 domain-containing protein [Armatimonadota bacterium]
MSSAGKTERLEARLTVTQKELIQQACRLSGRSVTDFVTATLVAAAQEAIREHQVLSLTLRESEQLAAALAQPPEPTAALREAWARRFGHP